MFWVYLCGYERYCDSTTEVYVIMCVYVYVYVCYIHMYSVMALSREHLDVKCKVGITLTRLCISINTSLTYLGMMHNNH